MKAVVIKSFATVNRRYKAGDEVTVEEVGEALFKACTDHESTPAPKAKAEQTEKPKKG